MVARGPKPQPAAIEAQKAPVRSRHKAKPDLLPPAKVATVAPPTWLKDDGLRIWKRLAAPLSAARLLTETDRETFARYCRNFARWLKMQLALDALGEIYTVTTDSGTVHRPRPEFLIADRLERQLLAIEDRFGLNPAERQRIFLARSQTGASPDLFGDRRPRSNDPATQPTEPARPAEEDPIGLLN